MKYSDGFELINGRTVIKFNETKIGLVCNKCGSRSTIFEHKGPDVCSGEFVPELKKYQGSRVKRYRKALKAAKINFTELMCVGVCTCQHGFDLTCDPGQLNVIFSWSDR